MKIYPLLSAERAAEIVSLVRSEQWTEGKTQRGNAGIKVTQELRADYCQAAKPLLDEIVQAIGNHPLYQREMLEVAYYPRFSRYLEGGEYKVHVDSAFMGEVRTDLAMTLFLNADYDGGELCIEMADGQVARVKASPGNAVVYECWRPHWVLPVTRGERIVAITWLQCRVADAEDREILDRVHVLIDDLEQQRMSDQERFAALGAVHNKLYKRFAGH